MQSAKEAYLAAEKSAFDMFKHFSDGIRRDVREVSRGEDDLEVIRSEPIDVAHGCKAVCSRRDGLYSATGWSNPVEACLVVIGSVLGDMPSVL